jgi:hypothetical protein
MPNRRWKKPNALKHGVFSGVLIVPGEDPREFQQLVDRLVEEWAPAGATEEDAVLTIAKGIWFKRRAARFLDIQSMKNICNPNHPAYDESFALTGVVTRMQCQPETAFEEYARRALRPERITYLEQKFPRGHFGSTAEWAQAIIDHVTSVLLPKVTIDDAEGQRWALLIQSAENFSGDLFDRELTLEERLNVMIERATKRLIHIKAMKQMFGAVHKQRQDEHLRKLPVQKEFKAMKASHLRQ